jgi:hypothetical protein
MNGPIWDRPDMRENELFEFYGLNRFGFNLWVGSTLRIVQINFPTMSGFSSMTPSSQASKSSSLAQIGAWKLLLHSD